MANEQDLRKLDAGDMKNVDGGYKYVIESRRVYGKDGALGDEEGLFVDFYSDDANLDDDYATDFENGKALTLPVVNASTGRFYTTREVRDNASVVADVINDGLKILGK